MPAGIIELALIVVATAVLGVAARLLKQPVILAYIAAGSLSPMRAAALARPCIRPLK